jgi:hypothetical protein
MDTVHRRITNDDVKNSNSETHQLISTIYLNAILFSFLLLLFEIFRHIKSIFQPRLNRKFEKTKRVPPKPPYYPFGWIYRIVHISDEEVLRMIGLDGYMLLRYINICFRMACFLSFFGLTVLVPIYYHADGGNTGWSQYTLANIPDNPQAKALWSPVVFCYIFSGFICQLLYTEYKNFIQKRLMYLMKGDSDTPTQTYYTVMIEKIPTGLRSVPLLTNFFERLFPGKLQLNNLIIFSNYRTAI